VVFLSAPVPTSRTIICSADDDAVRAFDRRTLEPLWSREIKGFLPHWSWDDRLVVGGIFKGPLCMMDGESGDPLWALERADGLVTLDPRSGEPRDLFEIAGGVSNSVTLCDDVVLYSPLEPERPVVAYSLADRRTAWSGLDLPGAQPRPAYQDFGVAFVPGSIPGRFVAVGRGHVCGCTLEDGRVRWAVRHSVPNHWPNVHAGRVYVFSPPTLTAFDESTGEKIFSVIHPKLEPATYPKIGTVFGNGIVFGTETGHIAMFDLNDGGLVWLHKHPASVFHTAEIDGRLYASTGNGILLVFETEA
jgi:outer membrane protein assembly factor BamB